jgi:hypothetical protein
VSALYPQGESRFTGPIRPLLGPAALTAANFVRLRWAPVPGALSYNLVRTATAAYPTSAAILVTNTTSTFVFDQGGALGAYVLPTYNPPRVYSLSSANGPAIELLNNIRSVSLAPFQDAGLAITNCKNNLPPTGGTCDARGLEGAQTAAATILLDKPGLRLLLGAATLSLAGSPGIAITAERTTIEGLTGTYVQTYKSTTVLNYLGTGRAMIVGSGAGINIAGVQLKHFELDYPAIAGAAVQIGVGAGGSDAEGLIEDVVLKGTARTGTGFLMGTSATDIVYGWTFIRAQASKFDVGFRAPSGNNNQITWYGGWLSENNKGAYLGTATTAYPTNLNFHGTVFAFNYSTGADVEWGRAINFDKCEFETNVAGSGGAAADRLITIGLGASQPFGVSIKHSYFNGQTVADSALKLARVATLTIEDNYFVSFASNPIQNTAVAVSDLVVRNNANDTGNNMLANFTGVTVFNDANGQRLFGPVGIGTLSVVPADLLHIQAAVPIVRETLTNTAGTASYNFYESAVQKSIIQLTGSTYGFGPNEFRVGTIAAIPLVFWTNTVEAARIDAAGKLQLGLGLGVNAGGFKHQSVTTGAVAAATDAAVTLTWTTAFADALYEPQCSLLEATTSTVTLRLHHIESFAAASVVVRVVNDDPANPHTGTLYCTGVHQ